MADFDTGDIVRLGCVQVLDGIHDIVNVLHMQITAGGGLAFAAAAQDFQEYTDALYALITTRIVNNQLAGHISVKNVSKGTVWGNIAWGSYVGGTDVQDALAAQVAMLVYGRTHLSRVQVRKYLGVFSEVSTTNGLWDAAARVQGNNFIDYHIQGQTMGNGLVLKGGAYSATLARMTFATSGTTSEVPVIQRRRRLGRGS